MTLKHTVFVAILVGGIFILPNRKLNSQRAGVCLHKPIFCSTFPQSIFQLMRHAYTQMKKTVWESSWKIFDIQPDTTHTIQPESPPSLPWPLSPLHHFLLLLILFYFLAVPASQTFLGQGSNSHNSSDLSHSCDNVGSLTIRPLENSSFSS